MSAIVGIQEYQLDQVPDGKTERRRKNAMDASGNPGKDDNGCRHKAQGNRLIDLAGFVADDQQRSQVACRVVIMGSKMAACEPTRISSRKFSGTFSRVLV